MKNKELKNLAHRITEQERIIQNSSDEKIILKAQNEIMSLTKKVKDFNDLMELDEMIQKFLNEDI